MNQVGGWVVVLVGNVKKCSEGALEVSRVVDAGVRQAKLNIFMQR